MGPGSQRYLLVLFLTGILCALGGAAHSGEKDLEAILDGIAAISAPGVPGPLCVFGKRAFPVVCGSVGGALRAPVVAAGEWGLGRVAAFGHPGYFDPGVLAALDTGRLLRNLLLWTGRTSGPAGKNFRVAVHGHGGLLGYLVAQGFRAEYVDLAALLDGLQGFDALCVNPNSLRDEAALEAVRTFVREGKGLVTAELGWGWLQLNPGKHLERDHPGNRLLAPAGILWADGYLQRTSVEGYTAATGVPELTHAGRALESLEALEQEQKKLDADGLAQAEWTVTLAARSLPPDDGILLPALEHIERRYGQEALPSPERPLTPDDALERIAITLFIEEQAALPPEARRAHPAAARFPGAVPEEAPRVVRSVPIDGSIPGWHSTGLYAPPGEVIEVTVPEAAAGKGFAVRIGAHSDGIWHHAEWHRIPAISHQESLAGTTTRTASAFGGLIYVEAPGRPDLPEYGVEIRGAVLAPRFVLGRTPLEAWRKSIRARPAPWAELETAKVVLTLPSETIRSLDDPGEVMRFWDVVLDGCAELAQRPFERERPERFVTDAQISAGYMHAGYPIMTHLDIADTMVDIPRIKRNGHGGVWGLFHELGHNHQSGDWTFAGTGEVTCNLFTLYVFDRACGIKPSDHGSFKEESRRKTVKAHLDAGASFDAWKGNPFLALIMYIQLQEAFGWDAFKKVFAEYRGLNADERPRDDDAKRDQWMVRLSRAVERDLGPFFQAWGVPTSEAARASIAGLPDWLPPGFPPE